MTLFVLRRQDASGPEAFAVCDGDKVVNHFAPIEAATIFRLCLADGKLAFHPPLPGGVEYGWKLVPVAVKVMEQ